MSTPIDLDLVELRCKLRDWYCWRRDVSTLEVTRNEDTAIHLAWTCYPLWPSGRRNDEAWAVALNKPRLTLADIIADPGEGWTVRHHGFDGWIFELTEPGSTVLVKVGPRECHGHGYGCQPALSPRSPEVWGLDDTRDAVAHLALVHAVTDLLIKLAEVES
jgi:hypothetical protein